jgi:uncharacterized membrane protein
MQNTSPVSSDRDSCKGVRADMARGASLVLSRTIEAGLVLLGAAVLFVPVLLPLLLWELLGVVYLVIRIVRVSRSKRHSGDDQAEWLGMLLGRRSGFLLTLFTSLVGLTGGVLIMLRPEWLLLAYTPAEVKVAEGLAVPAVLIAWGILHFGYADRYAQAYYAALPDQILIFPNTPRPVFIDFAYFSFTVGTSFAASDVETNGTAVRGRILAHGVLSFLYNTATLAVAIGVLTS